MLAKMTSKNQITLPKAIVSKFPGAKHFEIELQAGSIVLRPVRLQRADAVREKLAQLELTEEDIQDAVNWSRGRS